MRSCPAATETDPGVCASRVRCHVQPIPRASWRPPSGFTLIEIMVVLVVLGVVASLVVLNIAPDDRGRSHQRYLSEIENFVLGAYAEVRLSQQDHALHWFRDQVALYSLNAGTNDQGERAITMAKVDSWELPDTLEFQLYADDQHMMLPGYSGDEPDPDALQILIQPDGQADNPWAMQLVWQEDGERWQRLVSDGLNRPQWRLPDE